MFDMLKEKAKYRYEKAAIFTQKLINTPSVSLNESAVAKLIFDEMTKIGFDHLSSDEAGNIVGVFFGKKNNQTILLNSHMDTMPITDEIGWNYSPFEAVRKDGKIFGIGASDCKGGIAAQIYAAFVLKNSMLPLDGNLVVALTTAEENGASLGVKKLISTTLPDLHLKPDFAILGEPTSLGIYYGHDGWIKIEIKVEGINQFQVDDAANEIFKDLENNNKNTQIEEMLINHPQFENVLDRRIAKINLSKRFGESENYENVLNTLKNNAKLIASYSGKVAVVVDVKKEKQRFYTGKTTTVKHITNAWCTDPFNIYISKTCQALKSAQCEVRPGKWKLGKLGMGTAGSVLLKEFNIPTIGYGPGCENEAHKINESVEINQINNAIYGTTVIIHSLIGTPVFGWTSDEI